MYNEESEGEHKPTFGASLERFRAGRGSPSPSPSRYSRRLNPKRGGHGISNEGLVKSEPADDVGLTVTPGGASAAATPIKKEGDGVMSSALKLEADNAIGYDQLQSYSNTTSPSAASRKPIRSAKKRKVHDEKQFEGMKGVPDRIDHDLDILFCGINPGVRSSEEGFHYAHPSNRFYRILHESGLTPHKLKPSESPDMPDKYKLGLTDLVLRCTARADQVPSMEFRAGATLLLKKLIEYKPKIVCFVGMDVYRQFRHHFASVPGVLSSAKNSAGKSPSINGSPSPSPTKSKGKQSGSDVQIGLQNLILSVPVEEQGHNPTRREQIRLFVIPSTSGLAASYSVSSVFATVWYSILKHMTPQDADRITYLQDARQAVKAIRLESIGPSLEDQESTVVVKAEDFLEDKIVKLASGEWAFTGTATASAR